VNATLISFHQKFYNPRTGNLIPLASSNVLYKAITKILWCKLNQSHQILWIKIKLPLLRIGSQYITLRTLKTLSHVTIGRGLPWVRNEDYFQKNRSEKIWYGKSFGAILITSGFLEYLLMKWRHVNSPKFTLAFNGYYYGFFENGRGHRKGGSISPWNLCQ